MRLIVLLVMTFLCVFKASGQPAGFDCDDFELVDVETVCWVGLWGLMYPEDEEYAPIELYAFQRQYSGRDHSPTRLIVSRNIDGWVLRAEGVLSQKLEGEAGPNITDRRFMNAELPEALGLKIRNLYQRSRDDLVEASMTRRRDIICLGGTHLEIYAYLKGEDDGARLSRHQCGGPTKLEKFADELVALALRYDPEARKYLRTGTDTP